jgi:hypothetical protein
MIERRAAPTALFLGIAAGLMAFVLLVNTPDRSMLWSAVLDAGHTPLFGLFALMILRAASAREGPTVGQTGSLRIRNYVLALGVTVGFGALTEVLQGLGSRHAELWDFIRDVLGGSAVLLLTCGFDRRAGPHPAHGRSSRAQERSLRVILVFVPTVLLAVAFLRVTTVAVAYLRREAIFPRICEFDDQWQATLVGVHDAVLTRGEPAAGWGRDASDGATRLTFLPAQYPGMSILEPHPDWTGYKRLVFDVYSEEPAPVGLVLRINDARHNNAYGDRFNRTLVIQPGSNRISVALDDVLRAPRTRPMEMTHIRGLTLFAVDPPIPFSIYLDGFRLER